MRTLTVPRSPLSPAAKARILGSPILASSSCLRLFYHSPGPPLLLSRALLCPPWAPPTAMFSSSVISSIGIRAGSAHRRPAPCFAAFLSTSGSESEAENQEAMGVTDAYHVPESTSAQRSSLKSGLYLVATPIGNLEDITLRALRVLKSVDVILAEDTRHSRKLLQHFSIKTPLLSFHKFNETQRESSILSRLHQGDLIAMISDAGTPGISDPGMELVKSCVNEGIPVIPIPGASALLTALSASGLSTDEFTFVGFLPKHMGSRRERLMASASEKATQVFFVPPHKLHQFLQEASLAFGGYRHCVIAREMTKIHEEFWRGTLELASKEFCDHRPKGEITFLIEGNKAPVSEIPTEAQLESSLRCLISRGNSLSEAVRIVAEGTSSKRKQVYSLALKIFAKQTEAENHLS